MSHFIRRKLKALYYSPYINPLRPSANAVRLFNWYFRHRLSLLVHKSFTVGEVTNFTYDLTPGNLKYLAHTLALVSCRTHTEIANYIAEARDDAELKSHVASRMKERGVAFDSRVNCLFGRRLGWYALVRALRPKIVVETGVERGHGAVLLCAALLRNRADGYDGHYFGLDIAPHAGWLLSGKYAQVGAILYGDSCQSLEKMNEAIDIFINDSDHSAEYEGREYKIVEKKLSPTAVILGDNAHATDELLKFSERNGRKFLFFREEPANHWYPGAGIGISFVAR